MSPITLLQKYYYTDRLRVFPVIQESVTKPIHTTNTIYQFRRHNVRENKENQCPTLTANMGAGGHNVPIILDKDGVRKLTPRERGLGAGRRTDRRSTDRMSTISIFSSTLLV